MKENVRFYRCPICGNVIGLIDGDMEHIKCCGKPMEQMIANTTDKNKEKHVPVVEVNGNDVVVRVGEVDHPMIPAHFGWRVWQSHFHQIGYPKNRLQ